MQGKGSLDEKRESIKSIWQKIKRFPDVMGVDLGNLEDELDLRLGDAIKRYHEHFKNDGLITEPSSWSREKWIEVIDECIKKI